MVSFVFAVLFAAATDGDAWSRRPPAGWSAAVPAAEDGRRDAGEPAGEDAGATTAAANAASVTFRFFGSAGAESQLTPANGASPLNPRNVLDLPFQTNVADANALAELAGDRWKGRVKLRAEATDRGSDSVRIGEAFVRIQPRPWLDLTVGRVIEKWGTGYGWTPTNFVGPMKNPTDPDDRRGAYMGVDMLRGDVSVKGTTVSLYALRGGAVAARAYRLIGGTDVSLHYRRDDDMTRTGLSLSRVFGDALEMHGEVARIDGITRALVGGQYTFRDNTNLVVELYHATDGLTQREWDAFRALDDLREANETFAPLRMGRSYAFVRAARPFGRTSAELIVITNVRDGSSLARATITRKIRPTVSVFVMQTEFLGGGEFAYLQVARVTTAGLRVWF